MIVYSKTFDSHLSDLSDVFDRLRAANLKLKPTKCKFARSSVKFLGHIVSNEVVRPNPEKIQAVQTFLVPSKSKDVRSFLGLANYYRRFVKSFAEIASPLNALTSKHKRFDWTPECQVAFDKLKHTLCTAPILVYPDFN